MVDRLLASPHYGERMAVWWLDLVRYADTIGYHSDNPMNVSPYRDYVITAFNANKPFDQFTIEQLAGDLLPNADAASSKIATAYNRLLQTTEEGGAQAKEYEAKYASDRVRNFGQVWLGGTIMCCRVPQPQVRPVHAGGLLLDGGVLRGHPGAGGRRPRAGHADPERRSRRRS